MTQHKMEYNMIQYTILDLSRHMTPSSTYRSSRAGAGEGSGSTTARSEKPNQSLNL